MGPPPRNAAPRVEPPRDPHAGKARDEPESRAARLTASSQFSAAITARRVLPCPTERTQCAAWA